MVRKQQYNLNIEQNTEGQLLRNPYCSNEGAHCGCRFHHVTCQVHQAPRTTWSLWKTFLVCLLACLVATAITALVFYFGPFANPTNNTTIVIHTDCKSSQDLCNTPSTPSPTSSPGPELQTTPPTTTTLSAPTSVSTSVVQTTGTTTEHEAIIEYDGDF